MSTEKVSFGSFERSKINEFDIGDAKNSETFRHTSRRYIMEVNVKATHDNMIHISYIRLHPMRINGRVESESDT
jgi:hypothetical protein